MARRYSDSDSESSATDSGSEPEPTLPVPPKKVTGTKRKEKSDVKRATSAYMFFCQRYRPILKQQNPGLSFGEMGKLLGQKWKSLPEDEKKEFHDKAATDKLRYQSEKGHVPKKAKVKRPPSAFILFSNDHRPKLKLENPAATFGELGQLVGRAWKELSDEDKAPYVSRAKTLKVEHENRQRAEAAAAAAEEEKD